MTGKVTDTVNSDHPAHDPVLRGGDRDTLLTLVRVDERIRLLKARLDALPETAEVERLEEAEAARRRREIGTRRIAHDIYGTLRRLKADSARLRERRRDDIAGLRAVTDPVRRRDLRHDLEVAERRLAELREDIAREQRTLATFGHALDGAEDSREGNPGLAGDGATGHGDAGRHGDTDAGAELARAREEERAVTGEIRRQLTELAARSVRLRAALPHEILVRYERCERDQGIGAVELDGSTCRCCCIQLDTATMRRFAGTPPDRLVSCPECGVLLVRAVSSGGADHV